MNSVQQLEIRNDKGQFVRSLPQSTNKNGTAGRPLVVDDTILRELRIAFLMGYSDKEACVYAGIGESTLYDYQKSHPEFSEEKRA